MYLGMTWQEVFTDADALRDLVTRVGEGGCVAVLRELGVRPHAHYYERLRTACRASGIPEPTYKRLRAFADADQIRIAALRYLDVAPERLAELVFQLSHGEQATSSSVRHAGIVVRLDLKHHFWKFLSAEIQLANLGFGTA